MMKPILITLLMAAPAFGQSMYKCPSPTPGAPAIYQQMPCSPQGGGETVPLKSIPAGTGAGLSEGAKDYMADRDQYWSDKAKAQAEENKRQEALAAEHRKAKAAEDQASAQRATAKAILMTGRRW